jgi:hypothetical protein
MAQADWTVLTGALAISSLDRGVTSAITPPNGGGTFIYGFNSLDASDGVSGLYCNLANYNPTAVNKGGQIRGAIKRGISGGVDDFAPFLFIGLGGPDVSDTAYLLGLGDGDPYHIVLSKAALTDGLPDVTPGTSGVLRRSTATYSPDTWHHLCLEMVVNLNGDVILNCYESDPGSHTVTAPSWAAIAGMTAYIDDCIQVNSGSAPLTSGRMGFAMWSAASARRGYFDHIEALRQL